MVPNQEVHDWKIESHPLDGWINCHHKLLKANQFAVLMTHTLIGCESTESIKLNNFFY